MSILFELQDVSLRSPAGVRLDAVSVRIDPGVTAVIGPSGAGKTSLLDLLVGFELPSSGRVIPPAEALAWVPSDDGLWPHLPVRAHLEVVGAAASRVGELLDEFELTPRAEARPAALSRGERSRLAVARALATGAQVLVMDEPLAHVDPGRLARMWAVLLDRVRASGASLVFASHDPAVVMRAARRVVHLDRGRVTWSGATEELYSAPPTRDLALALGPVNWIEATGSAGFIDGVRDGPCVRPERIALQPDEDAPVVVQSATALGAIVEVGLRHDDGAQLQIHCAAPAGVAVGARVRVRVLAVLALLVAMFAGCGGEEPALAVAEVRHLSIPPDGALAPAPRGVAPGIAGELLVLDNAGRVLVLDEEGRLLRSWRMPEVEAGKPEGVCRLADGRIVVADTHYHRLVVFDAEGEVLGTIGSNGTGPGQFLYPVRVVQDPQGFVYVAEYGSNDRVQKLSAEGAFVLAFGRFGTAPGEFQRATGLAWSDGRVYVADAVNQRVQVFTDGGDFVGVLGGEAPPALHFPYDLSLGPDGLLYVVEYGAGRVSALTLDGALVGRFGSPGTGAGRLSTPWALTAVVGADGGTRVWIADTGNRRLVRLSR